MKKIKIESLIKLIDDPDNDVFEAVSGQLRNIGVTAIPHLRSVIKNGDLDYARKISGIIDELKIDDIVIKLKDWAERGSADLLTGVFLVSKIDDFDTKISDISLKLGKISHDIWLELNENLSNMEIAKVFNHILFDVNEIKPNNKNIYSIQEHFIGNLFKNKMGNSFSIAILYSLIANSLDIPVYCVCLPRNMILAFLEKPINASSRVEREQIPVQFYINPFNKGTIFNSSEIDRFLRMQKIQIRPEYYKPCSNLAIIRRYLEAIRISYDKSGLSKRSNQIERVLKEIPVSNDVH